MKNIKNTSKELNLTLLKTEEKLKHCNRRRNGGKSYYHKVDELYPWTHAKHVLKKYLGKSYDEAFAHYCTLVPKYQQHEFDYILGLSNNWGSSSMYCLDENNIIIENPKYKRISQAVTFYSLDYKEEYRLKNSLSKKLRKELPKTISSNDYRNLVWNETHSQTYNPYTSRFSNKVKSEYYEKYIVSGFSRTFSSKNDPTYQKLNQEKQQQLRLRAKKQKQEKKEKAYTLLSKKEIEAKNEIKRDKIKIMAKGFDYATSFRTEKQINPHVITENQGFK